MEDNQIVDLYWRRDEDAIQETGRKYTQFCFGIAWNILFNKEDSEECVNDTWFAGKYRSLHKNHQPDCNEKRNFDYY